MKPFSFLNSGTLNPAKLAGLFALYEYDSGLTTSTAAFAGTGTVGASAGTLTFSGTQAAVLIPGDTVTAGGQSFKIIDGAATSWTSSNTATVSAGTSFTVTRFAPRISQWNDLSGNNRHLTQATHEKMPLYVPGRGAMFIGSLVASMVTANAQLATSFTVIAYNSMARNATGNVDIVSQYAGAAAGYWTVYRQGGTGFATVYGRTSGFDNMNISSGSVNYTMQPVVFTANGSAGTGSTQLYANALTSTESATGTGVASAPNYPIKVGTRASCQTDSVFTDVVICNGVLSATTTTKVIRWLHRKRGLLLVGASLPSVIIGDSTVATYGAGSSVDTFLLDSYALNFSHISNIAVPGQTIAQQKTVWQALSSATKTGAGFVLIQVGLNDIDPSESAATALGRYQDLVNTVHADAPQASIILSQMTPCRSRLITLYGGTNGPIAYQKWLDMNTAIAGGGANAITGANHVVSSHVAVMNDGSGNLAATYDSGDGIHPNNAGKTKVAVAWRQVLVTAGILPQ